jgi:YVTN family beta-propeller protein
VNHLFASYVANNNLAVIEAEITNVISVIPVGTTPQGVAVTPDGSKVYVANEDSNNVSVIDTRKNKVIATIPVGNGADRLRRLHPAAAPICRDAREGKLLRQERLGARPAVSWAQCGPPQPWGSPA